MADEATAPAQIGKRQTRSIGEVINALRADFADLTVSKVRFLEAVKVGSDVRAKVRLADVTPKGPGRLLFKTEVTVEIKGSEKPALIAETLSMFIVQ